MKEVWGRRRIGNYREIRGGGGPRFTIAYPAVARRKLALLRTGVYQVVRAMNVLADLIFPCLPCIESPVSLHCCLKRVSSGAWVVLSFMIFTEPRVPWFRTSQTMETRCSCTFALNYANNNDHTHQYYRNQHNREPHAYGNFSCTGTTQNPDSMAGVRLLYLPGLMEHDRQSFSLLQSLERNPDVRGQLQRWCDEQNNTRHAGTAPTRDLEVEGEGKWEEN